MGKGLTNVFNPDQCENIRITNKRWIIQTSKWKETSYANNLGITIDDKLTWNSHTDKVTKRANQTTAFLCRNPPTCTKEVKARCYKSLVRPQLENAATIWGPHIKVNATKVEAVQRRAARFCFNDCRRTSNVTSMLQELGWEDLQTRRQQNKAIMMNKIVNNLVEIPVDQYLTIDGESTSLGNQIRFLVPFCLIYAYKGSVFPTAILLWKALPASIVPVPPPLEDFKVHVCADISRL